MNTTLNYFIIAIVIGYLIVAIVRVVLNRKLTKETKAYEKQIEEKMMALQKDIQSRTKDLQESMQMINQEYSKMMKDMGDQHKEDLSRVVTSLRKRKMQTKASSKPNQAAPDEVTDSPPLNASDPSLSDSNDSK